MSDSASQPVIIVVNPYSGTGSRRKLIDQLCDALRARGLDPVVCWGLEARQAALSDQALLGRSRCIVAGGGDGTLSAIVNLRLDCPVAPLPLGNENLFARHFGFSRDVVALADAIAGGAERTIDLGRAGNHYFTLMASAGIDAEIVHRVAAWRQATGEAGALRHVRRISYVLPTFRALGCYDWPTLELEADGQTVRGATVMAFNAPPYANRFDPIPHADPADGLLDWIVFERPGAIALLQYGCAARCRRLLSLPHVRHGRARTLRITSPSQTPLQIDGDAAGQLPIDLSIEPGALRVIDTSTS